MIASGEKKEEYRERKPYYHRKFLIDRNYDVICFRNGYRKDSPTMYVKLLRVTSSLGILEWGAPENTTVYILKLGKIISIKNLHQ